ncbi:MAG: hypothetical protein FWC00_01310 [Firmicutes bacterium]|nr:hypothetical protein [Bacillota bacterium]
MTDSERDANIAALYKSTGIDFETIEALYAERDKKIADLRERTTQAFSTEYASINAEYSQKVEAVRAEGREAKKLKDCVCACKQKCAVCKCHGFS